MFVDLMRKNQRWLMFVISVLTIISFIYLYSTRATRGGDRYGGGNEVKARIYDQALTKLDVERTARQFRVGVELGLPSFFMTFRNDPQSLWDFYVVQHEAEQLGIVPTDAEVRDAISKLPRFQASGGGGFDPAEYAKFLSDSLLPEGLSSRDLETLVRVDIQLNRLHELLDATVVLPPAEVRADYEEVYNKIDLTIVRLKVANFATAITVSDEDVKKYYEEQKEHLQTPERRKIQFVPFGLTDEQKKLPARDRTEAIQKLSDRVNDFTQKLSDSNAFVQTAKDLGLEVKETPEFSQADAAAELQALYLPPDLLNDFVASAFRLTAKASVSEPLIGPDNDAYYMLHLESITPGRQLSLEEAKPKIIEAIKNSRARAMLAAKAEDIRKQLLAAIAAGKSLADAAKAAGLVAQDIPPYSLDDRNRGTEPHLPDDDAIMDKADEMNTGELSPLLPTADGGVFVYVRRREPIDEATFAQKLPVFSGQVRLAKENEAFQEWLRVSREAAGLQVSGAPLGAGG